MHKTTILIADDHPLFRAGLRALLDSIDDLLVVGEAGGGIEAVSQAGALQPDVILMDIHLPDINGVEAARRIMQNNPQSRVLVLTMFEGDESVFSALRAGARGYILKGARQEEVLRAIRAVANNEAIFGPQVAARVIQFFNETPSARPDLKESFPQLTRRELEILDLIARDLSNKEIALRLVLSPKTVRNQVSIIFTRLGVASRLEAIRLARDAGLGRSGGLFGTDSGHNPGQSQD
jgi:DNA-binding NarL/FixJ family response regulator